MLSHNGSVTEPMKYSVWNDDLFQTLENGDYYLELLNNTSLCMHNLTHTCEGAKHKGKILRGTSFKRRSSSINLQSNEEPYENASVYKNKLT